MSRNKFLPHGDKVKGSLYGMLVGDALAVPGHWFYSPKKLRADYGEIEGMVAPKSTHAESMVQGMGYSGTIDIMHDKAHFYEGNTLAKKAQAVKSKEEEANWKFPRKSNFLRLARAEIATLACEFGLGNRNLFFFENHPIFR